MYGPRQPSRHHLRAILGLVVAGLLMAGCGSGQKISTVTVTTTASGASSGGVNSTPTSTSVGSTNANGAVLHQTVAMGVPVKDDGVIFKVVSAKTVLSLPTNFGTTIHPAAGARLVLVTVHFKNVGSIGTNPFCGNGGAVLGDPSHRNWQWSNQTIDLGSNVCSNVGPGLGSNVRLVFDVPKSANITYVALWNSDTDIDGQNYVDVTLS